MLLIGEANERQNQSVEQRAGLRLAAIDLMPHGDVGANLLPTANDFGKRIALQPEVVYEFSHRGVVHFLAVVVKIAVVPPKIVRESEK